METKGDIIQITNEEHPWFPALLVVTEVKNWGVQACVLSPVSNKQGPCAQTFNRLNSREYELVGKAVYIPGD